jgi:hypothetical protein
MGHVERNGDMRNTYLLVGKHERKGQLRTPGYRRKDDIKMNLNK